MRAARHPAALLALALASVPARAEVTRFEVLAAERPALEGRGFGPRGQAEKITARATIAVDPADPKNAIIADLDRAPRNALGRVEAVADVTILRPEHPNGTLVLELPNRGRRLLVNLVEETDGTASARLEKAGDIGRGFLLAQGYTLAWVGWQADVRPEQGLRLAVPTLPGITGPVRAEWVHGDGSGPIRAALPYPLATPDGAALTVRAKPEDARATPEGLGFRFPDPQTVEIDRPKASFGAKALYELTYTARDPAVTGLAFAALRDLGAFLRREGGPSNPLAAAGTSTVARSIGLGISQSGRVLRDLLYLGFNEDERGRMVFDGLMAEIPGARRSYTNARFAQPGRNPGPSEDRGYPVDQFPFTYAVTTDALTGRRDGLMLRCRLTSTCPKIMQVDSEFELWASHGSLLVTDTRGNHLDLPPDVRGYMIAGAPHFADFDAVAKATPACALPISPVSAAPAVRALLVALDRWIADDTEPPASRYPTLASGTLAGADGLYPAIPGLPYAGQHVPADLVDEAGAIPRIAGRYPLFLPRGDGDGNALGGIRLPMVEAARATYVGWNLRPDRQELCTQIGSTVPFAVTRAERLAAGDPRRALAERYPDEAAYVAAVRTAADRLAAARLLLPEDAAEAVAQARAGRLARLPP